MGRPHHRRQDCCCQSQHLQRPRQQPYDDYSASQRHRSTYNCAASYEDPRQQSRRSYPPPPLCCESHTPYHTHFDHHSSYRRNYTLSEPDRSPSRERRPHFGYEDRPYATRSPSPNPHSSYRTHSSPSPPPHHRQSSRSHTSPTVMSVFSPVKRDMAPSLAPSGKRVEAGIGDRMSAPTHSMVRSDNMQCTSTPPTPFIQITLAGTEIYALVDTVRVYPLLLTTVVDRSQPWHLNL